MCAVLGQGADSFTTTLSAFEASELIVTEPELVALRALIRVFVTDNAAPGANDHFTKLTYNTLVSYYTFHPVPLWPLIPTVHPEILTRVQQLRRLQTLLRPSNRQQKKQQSKEMQSKNKKHSHAEQGRGSAEAAANRPPKKPKWR